MKSKHMAWTTLVSFIVVVVMNYLVASGMIPMLAPQKEVSQLYQTAITPAGFTFSIWGVVYLLLLIVVVHMIQTADSSAEKTLISAVTPYLWGVYSFNILWNIVFCAQLIELSVVMIIGYWFCLFTICNIIRRTGSINVVYPLAFGIHTGWLTIASIVNLYALFVKIGWSWFGLSTEMQVLIGVLAAVLAVIGLQVKLRNPVLPLSIAWAFLGIYSKYAVEYGYVSLVSISLNIGIILMIGLALATFLKNDQKFTPTL